MAARQFLPGFLLLEDFGWLLAEFSLLQTPEIIALEWFPLLLILLPPWLARVNPVLLATVALPHPRL
jgi:hypothetical protein